MKLNEIDKAIDNLHMEICKVYDDIDKHEDAITEHRETLVRHAIKMEQLEAYREMVIEAEELLGKINPSTEF